MIGRLKQISRNPLHGAVCVKARDEHRRRLNNGEQVEFSIDAEVGYMLEAAAQGSSITWADEQEKPRKTPKRRRR